MADWHSLLKRQLKRHLDDDHAVGSELAGLIQAVNDAYVQSDADRLMLGRALDISSEELLEANSELRAIIQAFPDLFFNLDETGRILQCKAGAQKDLFRPEGELIGRKIQAVPDLDAATTLGHAVDQVRATGSIVSVEYSLTLQKVEGWYEARLLPLREGEILMIVRNISHRKKVEFTLQTSEREYRRLFETAHDAVILLEASTLEVIAVNRHACDLYGYSRDELVGSNITTLVRDAGTYAEAVGAGSLRATFEAVHWRKDGSRMSVDVRTSIATYQGEVAILSINRDITEQEEARKQQAASLSLFKATLESTADGILVVSRDGRVEICNQRFREMWQLPASGLVSIWKKEARDQILDQLSNPVAFLATVEKIYSRPDAESNDRLHFKDGRIFERYSRPQRIDGECVGRVWSFRDVTKQTSAEAEVRRLAYYDSLTGLPNRTFLSRELEEALKTNGDADHMLALLFMDLDRFKTINDTLGHHKGDLLLKAVAERLKECCHEGEVLARLGGDEFFVLAKDIRHADKAKKIATRLLRVFNEPFDIEGRLLHVTGSIGISLYPWDGIDAETLVTKADVAMYTVKNRLPGGFEYYNPEMDAEALARLTLENDMRRSLDRDEFAVYFQPQIDLVTGEIVAAEALSRWPKPDGTIVLPGSFIPLAETSGLIVPLGQQLLQSACKQGQAWSRLCTPPLRIAVNVSARQLDDPNFLASVVAALKKYDLDPTRLELELTESTIMADPDSATLILNQMREIGIGVALDDFGTGQSSLCNLSRLPISTLKIDRSLVRSCDHNLGNKAIVTAIISMSRSLGLRVIAEGVETHEELRLLEDNGCDEVQGFYFSPPIPAEEFSTFVEEWVPHSCGDQRPGTARSIGPLMVG